MGYEHKNTEEGVGWGVVLFLFDQLVVNGKEHEFQAVGDSACQRCSSSGV